MIDQTTHCVTHVSFLQDAFEHAAVDDEQRAVRLCNKGVLSANIIQQRGVSKVIMCMKGSGDVVTGKNRNGAFLDNQHGVIFVAFIGQRVAIAEGHRFKGLHHVFTLRIRQRGQSRD